MNKRLLIGIAIGLTVGITAKTDNPIKEYVVLKIAKHMIGVELVTLQKSENFGKYYVDRRAIKKRKSGQNLVYILRGRYTAATIDEQVIIVELGGQKGHLVEIHSPLLKADDRVWLQ